MHRQLVFAAALVVLSGCDVETVTGPPLGRVDQPIVNGTREPQVVDMTEGELLSVGWLHDSGRPRSNFCTATLIAPQVVVTASHCTAWSRPQDIGFSVGLSPSNVDASFRASEIHEHPSVDAALIVLAQDATSVLPELTPIPVNHETLGSSVVGEPVDACGYGDTKDASRDGRWCAKVFIDQVGSDEIVVDGLGEQGICWGDSGGPIIRADDTGRPVVLGVESWGDPSCVGVDHLTRLDVLKADWIDPVLTGETPPDPCDGLDFFGRCVGDVVEYCDEDGYQRVDCAARGLTCGWVNDELGYFCTESPSCSTEDELGRCEGNTVVRCEDGQFVREDCEDSGRVCILDAGGVAVCVTETPDEGGTETDAGLFPDVGGEVSAPDMGAAEQPETGGSDDGCACSATSRGTPTALLTALMAVLAASWRRRPRPRKVV